MFLKLIQSLLCPESKTTIIANCKLQTKQQTIFTLFDGHLYKYNFDNLFFSLLLYYALNAKVIGVSEIHYLQFKYSYKIF